MEAKGEVASGCAVDFIGAGPRFAERLAEAVYGGQVVLSEPAWAAIQDQLPGNAQVRSSLHATYDGEVSAMSPHLGPPSRTSCPLLPRCAAACSEYRSVHCANRNLLDPSSLTVCLAAPSSASCSHETDFCRSRRNGSELGTSPLASLQHVAATYNLFVRQVITCRVAPVSSSGNERQPCTAFQQVVGPR